VGEPRVGGQREAPGEGQPVAAWVLDRRTQQWVLGIALADSPDVAAAAIGSEPVARPLEGIGRQWHPLCACAFEEGPPVELCAAGKGTGERGHYRPLLLAPLAQGREEGCFALLLTEALAGHRAKHGVWAELQVGGG